MLRSVFEEQLNRNLEGPRHNPRPDYLGGGTGDPGSNLTSGDLGFDGLKGQKTPRVSG